MLWQSSKFNFMKKLSCFLFLLLMLAGCGQDYNSNYGDYSQYSPVEGIDTSTPEGLRLLDAYKVMQTSCFQCHSWSEYKTSAQWVSAGLVTRGNLSSSILYTRLKNVGGNMPPAGQLTTADFTSIETWISNL